MEKSEKIKNICSVVNQSHVQIEFANQEEYVEFLGLCKEAGVETGGDEREVISHWSKWSVSSSNDRFFFGIFDDLIRSIEYSWLVGIEIRRCISCGEEIKYTDVYDLPNYHEGAFLCDACIKSGEFQYCANCESFIRNDEVVWVEGGGGGEIYCRDCADEPDLDESEGS